MLIISIIVVVIWAYFAMLHPKSKIESDPLFEQSLEKSIFPFQNALLFGYAVGLSGKGFYTFISGSVYDAKVTYTLANISEWTTWVKVFLAVSGIIFAYLLLKNLIFRGSMSVFLRSVLSYAVVFIVGYWFSLFCKAVCGISILSLLTIPLGLGEAILLALYPFSAILFLLPTSSIAAMNRVREEQDRKSMGARAAAAAAEAEQERKDLDAPNSIHSMPAVITGPHGDTYRQYTVSAFSAEYMNDYGSIVVIHDSDLNGTATGATVNGEYYYW